MLVCGMNIAKPMPAVAAPTDSSSSDQFRYRLRIGANVDLSDDWFLGFRLETANNPRSTNVTFSQGGTNVAPFGKAGTASTSFITTVTPNTAVVAGKKVVTSFTTKTAAAVSSVNFQDTVFVGQIYLKYKAFSWLTLEAGKMPNPFITTPMVWDPDINPEGIAEQAKFTFGPFGGGDSPVAADGKDAKDTKVVTTASTPEGPTIDVFANLTQLVYDSADPENQFGSTALGRNDTWLLGTQVGARANFNKSLYVQVAPVFYNYSGHAGNDFATNYNGDPGGNQTGINDLQVLDIPAEFGWKWRNVPFRVFGDYAINLDGNERASTAGHPGSGNQNKAWQSGLDIGKVQKQGDWELLAYWQHSDQYALDPNLIDNDVFDAHLNMQGVIVRAGYALTDAVTLNFTYNHGTIIDNHLGTGGAGGTLTGASGTPALNNYNLIQADLNIKF